jgi:MFS family permease
MTLSSRPLPSGPALAEPRAEEAPRERGFKKTFEALTNEEYRYMWAGTLGSFGAMQLQQVAFGFIAYMLTGSAVVLGLVSLATGASQTLCSLFSGAIVDRLPKRRMLFISQASLGTIATLNFLLVLAGVLQVWQLLVVALLQGAVFAFNMPTRQSYLALVTRSPKELHNAIALNNAGQNLVRIVGPAVAGGILSIPVFGVPVVLFCIAASYGWALFSLSHTRNPGLPGPRKTSSVLDDLTEGWKYIGRHPILRSLLILSFATTMLGAPFQVLMPVFALNVFNIGSAGLGLLLGTVGCGALAGALMTAYLSDTRHKGRIQFVVGVTYGLAIAAFALSPTLPLALPALFLGGACGSILLSINNSLLLSHASREMYGRVMSAYMISFALFPIGVLPMSAIADKFGARVALAGGGLTLTVIIFGLCLLTPGLRKLR